MFNLLSRIPVAENRFKREHPPTLIQKFTDPVIYFLKTCFVDGSKALLEGKYSHRQGALIGLACLPAIIGALFMTVPGMLFPSPDQHAYYHFAHILSNDSASSLPVILGAISSVLGLRIPLSV